MGRRRTSRCCCRRRARADVGSSSRPTGQLTRHWSGPPRQDAARYNQRSQWPRRPLNGLTLCSSVPRDLTTCSKGSLARFAPRRPLPSPFVGKGLNASICICSPMLEEVRLSMMLRLRQRSSLSKSSCALASALEQTRRLTLMTRSFALCDSGVTRRGLPQSHTRLSFGAMIEKRPRPLYCAC